MLQTRASCKVARTLIGQKAEPTKAKRVVRINYGIKLVPGIGYGSSSSSFCSATSLVQRMQHPKTRSVAQAGFSDGQQHQEQKQATFWTSAQIS
ncbi:hypothetical protein ACLKA6_008050 [Drosophila palustris]